MLKRRGLIATTEADMIALCDIALHSESHRRRTTPGHSEARFLSGLEATQRLSNLAKGYEDAAQAGLVDPRLSVLTHAQNFDNSTAKAKGLGGILSEIAVVLSTQTPSSSMMQYIRS